MAETRRETPGTEEEEVTDASVEPVRVSVQELIQKAIDAGMPLAWIRREMATMGVRWSYASRHQNKRERTRRQRRHCLCSTGCGQYADWKINDRCFDCRAADWK